LALLAEEVATVHCSLEVVAAAELACLFLIPPVVEVAAETQGYPSACHTELGVEVGTSGWKELAEEEEGEDAVEELKWVAVSMSEIATGIWNSCHCDGALDFAANMNRLHRHCQILAFEVIVSATGYTTEIASLSSHCIFVFSLGFQNGWK